MMADKENRSNWTIPFHYWEEEEWRKFITPDELYELIRKAGLTPVDRKGMVFNPVSWRWSLSDRDLGCNYVTASVKPAA